MVDTPDMKQQKADTDGATDSTNAFNDAVQKSKEILRETTQFVINSGQAFVNLGQTLAATARGQRDSIILMKQQSEELALLAGAAFGATKAFDGFGNISGVSSFTRELDSAVEMAKGLGAAGSFALNSIAKMVGVDPSTTRSIEGLATKILAVGHRMAEVSDVGLKLQTGFLQMAGASGNLGRVFEQAGPHLGNLNNLLIRQVDIMKSATATTGASTEEVTKYYSALGRIPGYLDENIQGIDKAGHSINMLTAAIRIANATGQDQTDIIRDLTTAYTTYGASGEKALEFTARIADLSQKYNIQIEDTRSFMTDMANSFKFLGENVQGTAAVFDRFFQGLRDTGLSARASKDIVDDFGKSMANLTIAQKAFLSARTGGPGGLMGAVQIERELRTGNLDQVRKRIETALKEQFGGRIVTQEEGARSEQGAQEFVRQRMFLQQGPFGQIFGTGQEGEAKATRFLEALAKQERGGRGESATKLLQTDIQRGTEVGNKSYTALTKANAELEGIRMLSGVIALGVTQRAFTPGTQNEVLRRQLLGGIVDSMKAGTEAAEASKRTQQPDASALEMTRASKNLLGTVSAFGESAKSGMNVLKTVTTQGQRQPVEPNQIDVKVPNLHETVSRAVAARRQPEREEAARASTTARAAVPTPQNITVHVVGVCPDCHKKFVKAPQQSAILGGAPDLGPGF